MDKLKEMSALITGAARGIGKSIAQTFASNGADLALCDKNLSDCQKLAGELSQNYKIKSFASEVDVSVKSDCIGFVEKAIGEFGKIDILVNNAGITRDNLIVRMSEAEWDDVLNVNLKGSFLMIQAVAKYMMKSRKGSIINIASVAAQTGNAAQANYASSKGGVIALTRTMARELAGRNVRVNAVSPGFIETQMTGNIPQPVKERVLTSIPLARAGTPEDVSNAVLFLAGNEAGYITGQVLSVNGGLYI